MIRVEPEGREGVWLAERTSLKDWIVAQHFEEIHTWVPVGGILLGAVHSVESVLADIDRASRIALVTSGDRAKSHALRLILPAEPPVHADEHLEMYDIGEVTDAVLVPSPDPQKSQT